MTAAPDDDASRADARGLVAGALGLALWTSGLRAALFALRDGYHREPALTGLLARSVLGDLTGGLLVTLPAAALLLLVARRGGGARLLAAAATAALAWLFLAARWPSSPFHAPGFESGRALLAQGVVAAGSLAAAVTLALVAGAPTRGAGRLLGRASLAGGLATALAGAAALAVSAVQPEADGARPSVVLLSVDTLRQDHLGTYGDGRGLTPALDALAAESVVFERAYTPQPWTLSAHMSLLTGLSPSVHGLDVEQALPWDVTTLAEAFAARGYACLAVVDTVAWLHPRYGFGRGFHAYHQVEGDAAAKDALVRQLLDDAGDQPVFLFVHVYDAHSDESLLPYEADAEDSARLVGAEPDDFTGCVPELGCASRLLQEWNQRGEVPDEATRRWMRELYAAGVASVDRRLGALVDDLRERGLLERSLVLVTADHGEEFYEHGKALHDQAYEECVEVPLLVRLPGGAAAGRHGAPVSLTDVPATLAEHLELPLPAGQGRSFAPALVDPATAPDDPRHVLLDSGRGSLGIVTERWKLLPTRRGFELYDLHHDPGETRDLASSGADQPADDAQPHAPFDVAAARAYLEQLLAAERREVGRQRERLGLPADPRQAAGHAIESPLSAEAAEHLKALGYTGGDG